MAKYPFLSDQWVTEARRIYAEVQAEGALPAGSNVPPVRLNLVVNEAPFASEPLKAHIDTSEGHIAIDMGHLEKPDVTVSLDYLTARSLFIAGDVQAVMQAFLGGRIRVDGDMTKLLDPRSGIWPAGGATAFGSRPGIGTPTGTALQEANSAPDDRQRLDVKMDKAVAAATRLQEITE
jgi:putative sterol carrier protein